MQVRGERGTERERGRVDRRQKLLSDVQLSGSPFVLACGLHIRTLRINMNYPVNGTRLGVVSFQNLDVLNSVCFLVFDLMRSCCGL